MVQMKVRISLSKGFFPLLFSSLMILSLVGCAQETDISTNGGNRQLSFSVTTSGWNSPDDSLSPQVGSRALPISGTTFDTSKSFNMIADQNDGSGNYSTLIDKEPVSYSNNIWKTTKDYYWSGNSSKTISFYAYYPTDISKDISHTVGSAPTLSYTVPDDVTSQPDILVALKTNVSGNTTTSTDLPFKHILAAIQFSVGSNGLGSGTISSISIGDVYNSGTYTFGNGWTLGTSTKTFTISQPKTISGTSREDIYSGTYTLMMIPQTVNNATVTITYSNGGTLTKTISGTWEAGEIYNYGLSFIREYDYTGNIQSFTAPVTGTYKLEVWGGGSNAAISDTKTASQGKGGYATGTIHMSSEEELYICVGGAGATNNGITGGSGGYNGGGTGGTGESYAGGSGGGGATHIATTNRGLLSNYSSYKDEVLIVAGGSGGSAINSSSGSGGGANGGLAVTAGWSATGVSSTTINGGTQTIGYAFGKGQNGSVKSLGGMAGAEGNGGGGSGWYGGYSYIGDGDGSCSGGSGGSGYLGGVTYGSMQNGVRSGNGYARITFVSAD
jgi:hypothetical protein